MYLTASAMPDPPTLANIPAVRPYGDARWRLWAAWGGYTDEKAAGSIPESGSIKCFTIFIVWRLRAPSAMQFIDQLFGRYIRSIRTGISIRFDEPLFVSGHENKYLS
jgi:hypothetical protein